MTETLTLTIQLSPEARAYIRSRVERGEYSSESDFISQSVEAMKEDAEALERWVEGPPDAGLESWMRDVVGPTYDRMQADPSRGIPSEEVEQHLERRRRLRRKTI